ncbi:GntR family transcriptional regulator [Clostridiaceae bacterium M8S5]|nr:GntR family transcriptional regulator [Clostridiaceae bacterium M8S5]
MKFDNSKPIYKQIIDDIKKDIVLGKRNVGDKLPSTRELAVLYTVNPNTAQRVYKEIELEGIAFTKRGKGTYINESEDIVNELKNQMANDVIHNFIRGMNELGYSYDEMLKIIKTRKLKEGGK